MSEQIYYMNICLALIAALTLALLAPRRARFALSLVLALAVVGVFTWATALDTANGYVDPWLHDNWATFGRSLACGYALVTLRMAMSVATHHFS